MRETTEKDIKCVIWDLDNTLWDGVLLEDREVKLRPNIAETIRELDRRGILQSIASKNDFDAARRKLEELGIAEYFLYPEVHWDAKSRSVANIQRHLNIGMDTLLFIDDQEFERDEVSSVHPEVTCLPHTASDALLAMPRLHPAYITEDSGKRRLMYQTDQLRAQAEESFQGPREEFLASLEMKFVIAAAKEEDLRRAEELTVRTNQLNSTGITYDYQELNALRTDDRHRLLICELTDRYGSYGKIGLALVELGAEAWHVKLLLMSCRVLSRSVGSVLLSFLMQEAAKAGKVIRADFRQTDRNRMMYATYRFAGFEEVARHDGGRLVLEHRLREVPAFPPFIEVRVEP